MPGESPRRVLGPRDEAVSHTIVEIWKTPQRTAATCVVSASAQLAARIAHSPGRRRVGEDRPRRL